MAVTTEKSADAPVIRPFTIEIPEAEIEELSQTAHTEGSPTVVLVHGGFADASRCSGPYSHRVLDGIGHNVPQEAPEAFADAILEVGAAR